LKTFRLGLLRLLPLPTPTILTSAHSYSRGKTKQRESRSYWGPKEVLAANLRGTSDWRRPRFQEDRLTPTTGPQLRCNFSFISPQ
jgi:hypothetical protein